MFTNNPFESVTKALLNGAGKLSSDDAQGAAKEMMDSLRAWGDLVQTQAQAAQAASVQAVEEFITSLRRDPAREWERRLLALETEVHRVKRESRRRAEATPAAPPSRAGSKEHAG